MAFLSRRFYGALLLVLLLLTCWLTWPLGTPRPSTLVVPPNSELLPGEWEHYYVSDASTTLVHAASMVELPNGDLRAFWFAGSREGAADVHISSSRLDMDTGLWSDEKVVIGREWLEQQWGRPLRKLGNMVPVLEPDGSLRLFLVAVSVGGWAASRIVVLHSSDGEQWRFDGDLKISPFLNISHLVKTAPISFADGTIGLPVYHEFLGKFGELVRLDAHNQVISKARIGKGRTALQPVLLVTSPQHVKAFFRPVREPTDNKVYVSTSDTAGQHWTPLKKSPLENPGSALGGVALSDEHWLLAGNCNDDERDDLCIRETTDGGHHWTRRWLLLDKSQYRHQPLTSQEFIDKINDIMLPDPTIQHDVLISNLTHNKCRSNRDCSFQFDYPFMLHASNGDLHILYTWNKSLIAHAWYRTNKEASTHD